MPATKHFNTSQQLPRHVLLGLMRGQDYDGAFSVSLERVYRYDCREANEDYFARADSAIVELQRAPETNEFIATPEESERLKNGKPRHGTPARNLRRNAQSRLKSFRAGCALHAVREEVAANVGYPISLIRTGKRKSTLRNYARLTAEAQASSNRHREREKSNALRNFIRRTKNNPVLIGEPDRQNRYRRIGAKLRAGSADVSGKQKDVVAVCRRRRTKYRGSLKNARRF